MNDFDRLLALTDAAQDCNHLAREFIDDFGCIPEFSRDSLAAQGQARERMSYADAHIKGIKQAIKRWDEASDSLCWVSLPQATQGLPVFSVDGRTYTTAYEAARNLADAVLVRYRRIEGFDDTELCRNLAGELFDLAIDETPDFRGFIGRESAAAQDACPLGDGANDVRPLPPVESTPSNVSVSLDAKALAVFIEHPDWKKTQIAAHLKTNPKSLAPKRCPKLTAAIAAHKAPLAPRGSKDRNGNLEAWDEG